METSRPGTPAASRSSPAARLGVSEQFACRVTGQHRATQRHEPVTATPRDPDATLRSWLRHYAMDHPRRGFRPAYHNARAEGWAVNHEKIQCLWREEGLRVPQRRRHKGHGNSTAPPTVISDAPNRVWAVDFQFDVTTDGWPIKIVSIVDEHTGECLGGMVERSITGEHLIGELSRLATERDTFPALLRCDKGLELPRNGRLVIGSGWSAHHSARLAVARNGDVESINSRIRDECLTINSFWSLAQARVVTERLSFAVDQFTGSGHGHWAPPHGSVLCYPPAGGRGITGCLTPYFTT
jgi:putative transposase